MKGVTFEQVSAAAQALLLTGSPVTIRRVRDHLGTGSMSTVSELLRRWRDQRKTTDTAAPIPESLTDAITSALSQAATDARAKAEDLLAALKEDNQLLMDTIIQREVEIDQLRKQLEDSLRQRDRIFGKAEHLEADLANYLARLQTAQETAEKDRAELLKETQINHDLRHQCKALGEEVSLLRAELDSERGSRVAAEKEAAVLQAKLEGLVNQLQKAEERLERLEGLAH